MQIIFVIKSMSEKKVNPKATILINTNVLTVAVPAKIAFFLPMFIRLSDFNAISVV